MEPPNATLVLEENGTVALLLSWRSKPWFQLCRCKSGVTPLISRGADGDGNGSLTPLKLSIELRVSVFLPRPCPEMLNAEKEHKSMRTPGSGGAAWVEPPVSCRADHPGCSNSHRVFPTLEGRFFTQCALPSCCIVVRDTQRIPTQKYERALGVIGTDVTFICGGDLSLKGS